MNRWEIVFSGASALTLFFFLGTIQRGECTASNIRQRSDGCGPHPLIALAAASRSNGVGSLNDVLRAVRADPVVWPVMQNLLRRYDDCIRAADGLHYKRSDESAQPANIVSVPRVYRQHTLGGSATSLSQTEPEDDFTSASSSSSGGGGVSTSSTGIIIPWLPSPI